MKILSFAEILQEALMSGTILIKRKGYQENGKPLSYNDFGEWFKQNKHQLQRFDIFKVSPNGKLELVTDFSKFVNNSYDARHSEERFINGHHIKTKHDISKAS